MYIDAQNILMDEQALDADAMSENVIDLKAANVNFAEGEQMGIAMAVKVAADHTSGTERFFFLIQTDDDASMPTPTTHNGEGGQEILYSDLTADSLHFIPISKTMAANFQRYLGLYFNGVSTTPTVTITAWLCSAKDFAARAKAYPTSRSF